jgi:hypothetical protein
MPGRSDAISYGAVALFAASPVSCPHWVGGIWWSNKALSSEAQGSGNLINGDAVGAVGLINGSSNRPFRSFVTAAWLGSRSTGSH